MSIKVKLILLLLGYALSTYQPVIGIVSYPNEDETKSSIPTNYVRWLETAGAKILPIHPWYTEQQMTDLYTKVNGILFIDGPKEFKRDSQYGKLTESIFRKSISLFKDKKVKLPLFATGQGFLLLHAFAECEKHGEYDNVDYATFLLTDRKVATRLFDFLSEDEMKEISSAVTIYLSSTTGVSDKDYEEGEVRNVFNRIGWGYDKKSNPLIFAVEHNEAPVYGVHFNPERVMFDRVKENSIPQNRLSNKLSQSLANFFVNECRLNDNRYDGAGIIDTNSERPQQVGEMRYQYSYENKQ
jgi:gamma-glutamyl hydrolase